MTSRMSDVSPSSATSDLDISSLRSPKYLESYSTEAPVVSLRPTRRLNFMRPTPERS